MTDMGSGGIKKSTFSGQADTAEGGRLGSSSAGVLITESPISTKRRIVVTLLGPFLFVDALE